MLELAIAFTLGLGIGAYQANTLRPCFSFSFSVSKDHSQRGVRRVTETASDLRQNAGPHAEFAVQKLQESAKYFKEKSATHVTNATVYIKEKAKPYLSSGEKAEGNNETNETN
uniref:Uncharacterized protein n=1 Tax=Noctiluca scintillans TaxID=2966 RepID=A0A7S1FHM8_NOCSC|mmetsp:Transcript_62/g.182  ORF Transcript_62/g.182 Transcript_62/m.182 type:complete len:113 (+) Transcript_62:79-417(+)|eukprot:CAMPEP_0194484702 /NCGR_PEP_ID=MMETSP0253-20130528/5957_1 /TAXON_ID=2966 /ORGANISM="Noctiluca scintillans" /LENGTH=112 /DNA_ID=CAMNT_0039324563 /DNA_START=56 /DNA_END=394 /DNA_ORIENTATION=-